MAKRKNHGEPYPEYPHELETPYVLNIPEEDQYYHHSQWLHLYEDELNAYFDKQLKRLFEFYKVKYSSADMKATPANVKDLLQQLIIHHVPGYRITINPISRGRPKSRNTHEEIRLIQQIEAVKQEKKVSVSRACGFLAKKGEFGARKARSLETWYHDAKKRNPHDTTEKEDNNFLDIIVSLAENNSVPSHRLKELLYGPRGERIRNPKAE